MFENISLLVSFLKKSIKNYEQLKEEIKEQNNSSIDTYKDEVISLKEDIKSIANIDLEVIKTMIDESNRSQDEKNRLFSFIKSMRKLLKLNVEKETTFELTSDQLAELSKIYDIIDEIKMNRRESEKNRMEEISSYDKQIKKLNKIIDIIANQNEKKYIKDLDPIKKALDNFATTEEEKKVILLTIMKYNNNVYNREMSNNMTPLYLTPLNIDDVRNLFNMFGYDFDKFDDDEKDDIIKYGDLDNMKDVFVCIKQLGFPKFTLNKKNKYKNGKKLIILLINSDKDTLNDIVNYCKGKGVLPERLLSVVPALVYQSSQGNGLSKNKKPPKKGKKSNIVNGKSRDFQANIDFLSALGFDIDKIIQKCGHAILISHVKLVNNYRKFNAYGFKFDQTITGELTHPAFTFLSSNNFDEIVDQFIESGPLGYEYIKDNMSRVSAIINPDHIAFYNIYASYMDEDYLGNDLIPEGPFVNDNGNTLRLKGKISRLAPKDRNVPYLGITETNKRQRTMTITPQINDRDKFDEAVNNHDPYDSSYLSIQYDKIKELDKFIDPKNDLRYIIAGVIISKRKVERIYHILAQAGLDNLDDSLLYAITYNTIINKDNFEKIKSKVNTNGRRI